MDITNLFENQNRKKTIDLLKKMREHSDFYYETAISSFDDKDALLAIFQEKLDFEKRYDFVIARLNVSLEPKNDATTN